jgi:flagellar biosynthesis protein FlhG
MTNGSLTPPPVRDQAATLRTRIAARRCRVVTITSGKGGVGKTSLTANLGLELARQGQRVLVLDGDLALANLAILFNLAPKGDLADVLAGRRTLASIVLEVVPGLSLIPASNGVAELADLDEERRREVLAELSPLCAEADVLLIDTSAGIASSVIGFVAMAHRTLVVTTQEPTALSDAYAVLKAARRSGAARVDVVVNMATSQAEARQVYARLTKLTERFLGFTPQLAAVIPRDPCVAEAVVRQEPLAIIYPYSPATRAIAAFARLITDPPHERPAISVAVPDRR